MAIPHAQVPGISHRKLGDLVVTVLNDGHFQLPLSVLVNIDPERALALETEAFRTDPVRMNIQAFVISGAGRTILVDAGAASGFAPTVGRVPAHLREVGFRPEDIDTILLTHLHPDHIGALTDASGKAAFPNADLVLHQDEANFWLDPETLNRVPDESKDYVRLAQSSLAPYAARRRTVRSGEVLPGIEIVPLPGHSPGHSGYLIRSAGESLLIWGDIVHIPGVQFAAPEAGLGFDADAAAAAATRAAIFERAATERLLVAGMHLEFPAFGFLARDGAGFRWLPDHWHPDMG